MQKSLRGSSTCATTQKRSGISQQYLAQLGVEKCVSGINYVQDCPEPWIIAMTGCGKEILASPCAGRTLCRYFAQSRGRPRKESSSLPAHRIAFSIKARSESAAEISAHFCSAPSYRGGSASSELIASIPISKISSSGRFLCNDVVSRCFRGVLGFRLEQVGLCMEYIKTCNFQELSPAFPGEHGEDYFVAHENVLYAAGRPGLGIK